MKPVTRSKSMKVLYTGQKIVDRFLGFSMVSTNHLRSDNDMCLLANSLDRQGESH